MSPQNPGNVPRGPGNVPRSRNPESRDLSLPKSEIRLFEKWEVSSSRLDLSSSIIGFHEKSHISTKTPHEFFFFLKKWEKSWADNTGGLRWVWRRKGVGKSRAPERLLAGSHWQLPETLVNSQKSDFFTSFFPNQRVSQH